MKEENRVVSKTFCIFPWNQIHVTPIGVIKPCCIFDEGLKGENQKTLRMDDDTIENLWNSKSYRELRLKMINGEVISGCKKCYEEERVSNTSDRIRALQSDEVIAGLINTTSKEGNYDKLPYHLNLKIGNKCNLKCRMCQPLDSTMIDSEFYSISKKEPKFRSFDNANAFDYNYEEVPIEIAGNWIESDLAKNNILKLLSGADTIYIAGGETTFTPEAVGVLEFCVENNISRKIEVVMSSNLTRITDDLIDLASKFKIFKIIASIDGVGNQAEYIRYPSKWHTVKNNFMKLVNAPENVVPVLAPTVQIYNILNIVDVLNLIEEIDCKKWDTTLTTACHLTTLFDPQHLSIRHLPRRIKDVALEKLLTFQKKSRHLKKNDVYSKQFELMINILREQETPQIGSITSREYLSHFMQYTADLDKERHQRLQDFIPELYKMLQDENIVASYPSQDPRNYTYYKFRDAGFKLQQDKKPSEAIQMLLRANEMYAEDPDLLFSLGACFRETNQYSEALDCFLKVEKISPDNSWNLKELGIIKMEEKEPASAIEYFVRALPGLDEIDQKFVKQIIHECEVMMQQK